MKYKTEVSSLFHGKKVLGSRNEGSTRDVVSTTTNGNEGS